MPLLDIIPPALWTEDVCDFCSRAFARSRGRGACCPSCGSWNQRDEAAETNMLNTKALDRAAKPRKQSGSKKGRR